MKGRKILRAFAEDKLGEPIKSFNNLHEGYDGVCIIHVTTEKGEEKSVKTYFRELLYYSWRHWAK